MKCNCSELYCPSPFSPNHAKWCVTQSPSSKNETLSTESIALARYGKERETYMDMVERMTGESNG